MNSSNSWLVRCLRLHRFDRNPLRRRSDRLETVAVLVTVLVFVVGMWPVAVLGRQTYADGLRAEITGSPHRRPVVAEVVGAPQTPGYTAAGRTRTVRWTAPDGTPRTGQVVLPAIVPVGSRTQIWLDAAGRPTDFPQSHLRTVMVTVLTVIGVAVWGGMILLLCLAGVRFLLNRRREAEWERAWRLADQRWRRPRQN
ncbi:hypothetical protein GCM10010517_64770 [Streptosporangium fragile]|uniref:DUF3592 domain-containing protein n=1 Tax=Streptosporangium fragile TaxID=46186 RepID=A0ABP6IMI6_9ACTN